MSIADEGSARKPDKPFYFNTSEHLLRIGRQQATTLSELWQALQTCPDDSIFSAHLPDAAGASFYPARIL
jgi:hypothetical protein